MLASSSSVPDFPGWLGAARDDDRSRSPRRETPWQDNAQAWSAWLICAKKQLDDAYQLLADEDDNALDWLQRASQTLEIAALHAKDRSLQVTQKLQWKFTPHSVTAIPKRAPKRPAAPKHEQQIKREEALERSAAPKQQQIKQEEASERLVPPKLPPKREQQSKQDEAPTRNLPSRPVLVS